MCKIVRWFCTGSVSFIKKNSKWEMAQQLRTLTTLAGDPGSIPNTQLTVISNSRIWGLLTSMGSELHTCPHMHAYTHVTIYTSSWFSDLNKELHFMFHLKQRLPYHRWLCLCFGDFDKKIQINTHLEKLRDKFMHPKAKNKNILNFRSEITWEQGRCRFL